MRDRPALSCRRPSRKYGGSCGGRILNRRGHHNTRRLRSEGYTSVYVRIYLAKVHRTSGARTGFSRPIIKMHARYVTTLCTYVPKYYPAPVLALSFSLSLSPPLAAKYSKRIYGVSRIYRVLARTSKKEILTSAASMYWPSGVIKLIFGRSIVPANLLFTRSERWRH